MKLARDLRSILERIDAIGYKAYKDIEGEYSFQKFCLYIDHVQGDPYASPSRIRVRVDQKLAGFPLSLFEDPIRKMALEDYLTRTFSKSIKEIAKRFRGSGKSGSIRVLPCSQQVIPRTSVLVNESFVETRFTMGLPARGRKILGQEAEEMFFQEVPRIVERSLFYGNLDSKDLDHHLEVVEDAEFIRKHLEEKNLVAFVADGSLLPRASGVDERPKRKGKTILFSSPSPLQVIFHPPNSKKIKGMGIPRGITLIVGGGYHGKSTLLDALALGCYNHIPGDGREFVISSPDTVMIRAEDGRFVENVDISPFISNLPLGEDTTSFSTLNASGSTSQAANIMEALEMGARVLLIDEDTSATNFMIRDERMQRLVRKDKEPITPLIDKIKLLYRNLDVSTILVMGGSGDYFDVADTVIMMDTYKPFEVSNQARSISKQNKTHRSCEGGEVFGQVKSRMPLREGFDPRRGKVGRVKIKPRDMKSIAFGYELIDLSSVEQLVEEAQTRSIGDLIYYATRELFDGRRTLRQALKIIEEKMKGEGLDSLLPLLSGEYAAPRKYELAAAVNRLTSLKCQRG
jgi:predicted ABC-class ATPase